MGGDTKKGVVIKKGDGIHLKGKNYIAQKRKYFFKSEKNTTLNLLINITRGTIFVSILSFPPE